MNGSLRELLQALDSVGIPWVSWKNNHELSRALDGKSDLDVYVPAAARERFMELARHLQWVLVENPVAHYPGVEHYCRLDGATAINHLHVYFRVVTGESWLKEYDLPLGDLLIAGRVRCGDVWIPASGAQALLFLVRHLLKNGSLFSRMLYRRELSGYREEWSVIAGGLGELGELQRDVLPGVSLVVDGSGLSADGCNPPAPSVARRFRRTLSRYLRFPVWQLPFRRLASFSGRLMNRVFLHRRKLLVPRGIVLAVSGVDGVGKSSMIAAVETAIAGQLTVRRFFLGRPQGPMVESLRRILKRRRADDTGGTGDSGEPGRSGGPARTVKSLYLARLRLKTARRAVRWAGRGGVAICDRWPTVNTGMMDGPRLERGPAARFEHRIYRAVPEADLCVMLTAPVDILVERNRRRVKAEKESDAEIRARFERNSTMVPRAREVIRFENIGKFDPMRRSLLALVWDGIHRCV